MKPLARLYIWTASAWLACCAAMWAFDRALVEIGLRSFGM